MKPEVIALICVAAAVVVGLIVAFVWFSNSAFTLTYHTVKSSKVQNQIKIVQLTDLHAKEFGKGNKKLLAKIAEQHPDFIAFTGDIVHLYRKRDLRVAAQIIASLTKIAPVYYVAGNHEMRNKKYRSLRDSIRANGAIVLDNASVNAFGISITGLNCAHLKNATLANVNPQTDDFKLLLSHEPQFLQNYASAQMDLVLCGHAHGGQWRIPFTQIGIYSPGQGLFPKYISGSYTSGKTQMLVSRGLGNSQCPLRLFNRPEVLVITLTD